MNLPEKWSYMSSRCIPQRLEWDRIKRCFWFHYRLDLSWARGMPPFVGKMFLGFFRKNSDVYYEQN